MKLPIFFRNQIEKTENKLGHWDSYVRSLYVTSLVLAGYFAGYEVNKLAPIHATENLIGALWAAATVLTVYKDHSAESQKSFFAVISAAFLGSLIAVAYLLWLPQQVWGLAPVIILSMLLSQVLGFPDRGRQMVSMLLIIVVFSHISENSPWVNAGMRDLEVFVGAAVGLAGGYFGEKMPGLDDD
ncbi:FUSC family protein [Acidithiobacillus sp. IBUN Pt1247-S3]|uniref:FUSC family protein n=1 Tax=Acidithiobacillus sp. IBUN Pt1247-S3 TaxID=3166642 RepID=UPI0034E5DBC9